LSLIYSVTYDAMGDVQVAKVPLEVGIPGEGNPSGQVFNGTGAFHGDIFIFASEDGTISGWRGPLGTSAETLVSRSNAVYKGITLVTRRMGPLLLGANFAEGTVDAYDSSLNLVGQFKDPHAPAGYAPFNLRALGKDIFVAFANQRPGTHDDLSAGSQLARTSAASSTPSTPPGAWLWLPKASANMAANSWLETSVTALLWPLTVTTGISAACSRVPITTLSPLMVYGV
jgi:uncharacterized protein (TIGR03118 family)